MGIIKERNSKDWTIAEEIKRWQEYTELYQKKKNLKDPDNHSGVVTHLEPDIVKCQVKLALESTTMNKARWNSSWAISNPKRWCRDSAALSMSANLENSAAATGLENVSFYSSHKDGECQGMFKLLYNCIHSIS